MDITGILILLFVTLGWMTTILNEHSAGVKASRKPTTRR